MGYSAVDKVLSLQEEELKFLENVRNCINMRIRCDRDYSASLLVVGITAQKCHFSDDIANTNIGKVWKAIASEMEALSILVNAGADEMTCEVLELMDELVNEKRALRKTLIEDNNRYNTKLDNLLKSCHRIQTDYQKCLSNYKNTKAKYEDLWLRLPKRPEKVNNKTKVEIKFMETKRKYKKLCQKLHILHNEYCLTTSEAKQYDIDLRSLLIPNLISYHELILMDSGEDWNHILFKFVNTSDLTHEKYRRLQYRLKTTVQNIISTNIYGDLRGQLSKSLVAPKVDIVFNEKLLDDYVGALKPNQLVIDTFTIDSLKQRSAELESKLSESQKDIREKRHLQTQYEQELKALLALCEANTRAQMGIKTRKRAIDIIRKDLVFVESEHERTHQSWERVGTCLSKIADIPVPNGLELNLNECYDANESESKPNCSSSAHKTSDTSLSYSTMLYTLSLGRALINKFKRHDISNSVSSLASQSVSTVSHCIDEKNGNSSDSYELCEEEWYHGALPRGESNKLLSRKGDFLIRKSQHNGKSCYVVSVLWNGYRHFIVNTDFQGLYRLEGPSFATLSHLIDHYQSNRTVITQTSGALLVNAVPKERWELNHNDIELKDKIGRGNFGDVFRGILKRTGTGTMREVPVAVKTCKINLPDEQKRKFLTEGRILRQYNHENIVQLIGICVHKQPVMIVMELIEGGSLLNYLRNNSNRVKLNLFHLMRMCIDAATGMEYLEDNNCIHRDLAARNCLIGSDNVVKISDFGMSREANMDLEYTVSDGMKQIPIKWTAPEALNYGRYTSRCDVWSYAILMWEIFTMGSTPYSGMSNSKARELIDNGYRLPCPPKTPQNVYQLMARCWRYEPEERPHFSEIKQELEVRYVEIKNKDIKDKSDESIENHL